MRGFTQMVLMVKEDKPKTDMYLHRQGNALFIGCRGIVYAAPISQVLRVIKGKLPFYYVFPKKSLKDKDIATIT